MADGAANSAVVELIPRDGTFPQGAAVPERDRSAHRRSNLREKVPACGSQYGGRLWAAGAGWVPTRCLSGGPGKLEIPPASAASRTRRRPVRQVLSLT